MKERKLLKALNVSECSNVSGGVCQCYRHSNRAYKHWNCYTEIEHWIPESGNLLIKDRSCADCRLYCRYNTFAVGPEGGNYVFGFTFNGGVSWAC